MDSGSRPYPRRPNSTATHLLSPCLAQARPECGPECVPVCRRVASESARVGCGDLRCCFGVFGRQRQSKVPEGAYSRRIMSVLTVFIVFNDVSKESKNRFSYPGPGFSPEERFDSPLRGEPGTRVRKAKKRSGRTDSSQVNHSPTTTIVFGFVLIATTGAALERPWHSTGIASTDNFGGEVKVSVTVCNELEPSTGESTGTPRG